MQIQITKTYQVTPVRMASGKNSANNECWRGCGEMRTLGAKWDVVRATNENRMEVLWKGKHCWQMKPTERIWNRRQSIPQLQSQKFPELPLSVALMWLTQDPSNNFLLLFFPLRLLTLEFLSLAIQRLLITTEISIKCRLGLIDMRYRKWESHYSQLERWQFLHENKVYINYYLLYLGRQTIIFWWLGRKIINKTQP